MSRWTRACDKICNKKQTAQHLNSIQVTVEGLLTHAQVTLRSGNQHPFGGTPFLHG